MAVTITKEDVVRVAKQIFPGLAEASIVVRGQSWSSGSVKITLAGVDVGDLYFEEGEWGEEEDDAHVEGKALGGLFEEIAMAKLKTIEDLRHFLEVCRDSLVRNLTALLELALGPVRVLPDDAWLQTRPIHELLGLAREFLGSPTLAEVLPAYEAGVARRRAAAAKPAGP